MVASFAGCIISGITVSAAEYSIQPSVNSRVTNNDNLLLSSDGAETETFFLEFTPRVRARRATEKWQADLDVSASFLRFEDDDFDSDNQNFSLQLTRRAETVLFQVVALNARQTTRSVDLDELGEIGFDIERRDRQYLRPSVTWTLNPTNQLAFGISGDNVHYGGFNFSDYDYYNADIAWTHQFDEKTQFNMSAFGSDYSSSPPGPQLTISEECSTERPPLGFIQNSSSETVGVRVGGNRQPNSRLSYRGSVGYRQVDSAANGTCVFQFPGQETFNDSSTSEGLVLDTGFDYRGESYQVSFSLSRSVSPAGVGSVTERDDLRASWSYRFSELVTFSLAATAFNLESLNPDRPLEREGFQIAPRAVWKITEKLSLNGGIVFRSTESLSTQNPQDKRDGLSTYIGFNYNFKPIRFTR